MHHERSERHVRADRAYPLDDHRERRGRVLLLGKGAVLTQRVAGPLAAELDEEQQRESVAACSSTSAPSRQKRHSRFPETATLARSRCRRREPLASLRPATQSAT